MHFYMLSGVPPSEEDFKSTCFRFLLRNSKKIEPFATKISSKNIIRVSSSIVSFGYAFAHKYFFGWPTLL